MQLMKTKLEGPGQFWKLSAAVLIWSLEIKSPFWSTRRDGKLWSTEVHNFLAKNRSFIISHTSYDRPFWVPTRAVSIVPLCTHLSHPNESYNVSHIIDLYPSYITNHASQWHKLFPLKNSTKQNLSRKVYNYSTNEFTNPCSEPDASSQLSCIPFLSIHFNISVHLILGFQVAPFLLLCGPRQTFLSDYIS